MIAAIRRTPASLPAVIAFLIISLTVAFGQARQGEPMLLPVDAAPLVVEGGAQFDVEIARSPDERARGLMFRTDFPDDRGMLFVFEDTRQLGFWMQNTPLPLDLVFIGDDGRVVATLPGEPFSTDAIAPGEPARFVLEVKRGIAEKAGIADGVRLRHPLIDEVAGD